MNRRKPQKDKLGRFLDKNMIETGRGTATWGNHKVRTKYVSFDCTQDEWNRIFGNGK